MLQVLLYFLILLLVIHLLTAEPKTDRSKIKGLSLKHWEGPDR